jgi:hypothetical protein
VEIFEIRAHEGKGIQVIAVAKRRAHLRVTNANTDSPVTERNSNMPRYNRAAIDMRGEMTRILYEAAMIVANLGSVKRSVE